MLLCKAKMQYLLTLQVSRYCILTLQSSTAVFISPSNKKMARKNEKYICQIDIMLDSICTNWVIFTYLKLWFASGQQFKLYHLALAVLTCLQTRVIQIHDLFETGHLGNERVWHPLYYHCRTKPNGRNCLLQKYAVTAFWLCRADHPFSPSGFELFISFHRVRRLSGGGIPPSSWLRRRSRHWLRRQGPRRTTIPDPGPRTPQPSEGYLPAPAGAPRKSPQSPWTLELKRHDHDINKRAFICLCDPTTY